MNVSGPSSRPQGILPGGCVLLRPMNDASGKEFKTIDELQAFVKKNNGQISLQPGASFEIYLPKSVGGPAYGSRVTRFDHFNKKSPLKSEIVAGKPAPVRMPGEWVRITALPEAKGFAKDRISLVTHESIMCRPPTDTKHFDLTVTVVP